MSATYIDDLKNMLKEHTKIEDCIRMCESAAAGADSMHHSVAIEFFTSDEHGEVGNSANVAPDILVMMLSAQVERYREKKEELERKINAFTINPGTPCN
ncbi:hypothetical protein [Halomonas casei]|uniref:hypothetical protein n=1 Tax=Halomonas casei TaxID=2742613 RepID=UPI003CECCEF2